MTRILVLLLEIVARALPKRRKLKEYPKPCPPQKKNGDGSSGSNTTK